jgi:hypothetical protein
MAPDEAVSVKFRGSKFKLRLAVHFVQGLMMTSVIIGSTLLNVAGDQITASAASVANPSCRGSNLVGAFVRNQVGAGHEVTTIAFTNVGPKTCLLGGYPTIIGLRGAKQYRLRVTGHGTYGGNLRPTDLAPRMSGALIVSTGDLCGPTYGVLPPSQIYSGMIVVLPKNEGTVQVPDVTFDTTCGLAVSQLGWRNHFSIQDV